MDDLQTKYVAWQCLVQEHQGKFEEEDLSERGMETAIRQLLPKEGDAMEHSVVAWLRSGTVVTAARVGGWLT